MLVRAREEEIEEMAMMAAYIVEEHIESYYGRKQKAYMMEHIYTPEHMLQEMEAGDRFYWLDCIPAGEEESVLGMLDVCGYLSCSLQEDAILIKNVYIMSEIRGRHILRECLDLLKQDELPEGISKIQIAIPEGYVQAINVFEHLGFTRIAKVEVPLNERYTLNCLQLELSIR